MAVGDDSRANDKPIKLTDFTESSDREDELDETIWSANLNISRNDLSDRLSFGLNPNATDAYDPWLDTPHAPVSASNTFISASFIHDDWQPSALGRLSEEYRGQDDDGFESWDIEIIQDEAGEISLVLDDIVESIPFEYFVYADIGNTRYDLREEGEVRFFAAEREIIQILLTTSETSVGEREDAIPTEYSIRSVYPNPFNPTLHISVALPEATTLHTQVYDMLGREVATIDHGRLAAGYHQFNWDAQVPSGIYFVRISSAEWNDVRKVMLMK